MISDKCLRRVKNLNILTQSVCYVQLYQNLDSIANREEQLLSLNNKKKIWQSLRNKENRFYFLCNNLLWILQCSEIFRFGGNVGKLCYMIPEQSRTLASTNKSLLQIPTFWPDPGCNGSEPQGLRWESPVHTQIQRIRHRNITGRGDYLLCLCSTKLLFEMLATQEQCQLANL